MKELNDKSVNRKPTLFLSQIRHYSSQLPEFVRNVQILAHLAQPRICVTIEDRF